MVYTYVDMEGLLQMIFVNCVQSAIQSILHVYSFGVYILMLGLICFLYSTHRCLWLPNWTLDGDKGVFESISRQDVHYYVVGSAVKSVVYHLVN